MYKSPLSCAKNKNRAQELSENNRVTNSKYMLTPTNLKITVVSQVFSQGHICNPGIDEGGGGGVYSTYMSGSMLQKTFEIFVL